MSEYTTISVTFAEAPKPVMKEANNGKWVKFGDENNYPEFLEELYGGSPKHGAIVNNKVKYILGKVIKPKKEDAKANVFLKLNASLIRCITTDIELFGGCYIECVPTKLGTGWVYSHIKFKRMRSNEDNSMFYYKKKWGNTYNRDEVPLKAFNPDVREKSIIFFKEYRPDAGVYPLPSYHQAVNYIAADCEVAKHTFNNSISGFTATKVITFKNGEPPPEKKAEVKNDLKNSYSGQKKEKYIISFINPGDEKPDIDDLGASDLTKENFSNVDDLISSNIYAAHEVTSPELMGVPSRNNMSSGEGQKLKIAYELFKNVYAQAKQTQIIEIVEFLGYLNGVATGFEIVPLDPVGVQFSENAILQVAPKSWIQEQLGIDTSIYTDAPIGAANTQPVINVNTPQSAPIEQAKTNDVLTNLTGRQRQNVMGIVRQFSSGKLTKAQAAILLKGGYGFTDQDVNDFLGIDDSPTTDDTNKVAFESDEDVANVFAAFGEARENFSSVQSYKATFAEDEEVSLLKAITKVKSVIPKFEVRYSYEKRPEVEGLPLLDTSRPFCVKMIGLNRFYTREDIQKISQILGYDVFNRTGGFWNNNGKTETHCRHEFRSNVVVRKK